MRVIISSLITLLFLLPAVSAAQTTIPPLVPSARPPGEKPPPDALYAEDGGAHGEVLESIVVPPKAKAPFTLILETVWERTLADGGTMTLENKRKIAREANGRIYMERWYLVPRGGTVQSGMTTIQISDPVAHTHINCFMLDPKKRCEMSTYEPSPETVYDFFGPNSTGKTVGEMGDTERVDLGKQMVSGVEAMGRRVTSHFNPYVFGNDRVMTIEREFWYSPKLGFNVLSTRSDPRIGKQTFTVTNLILSDPDPALYVLPDGFSLTDKRQTAPPEN